MTSKPMEESMKKEKKCLCDENKAEKDVLFDKFRREAQDLKLDLDVRKRMEIVIKELRKYEHLDSTDLENILYYALNLTNSFAIDESEIQQAACVIERGHWPKGGGLFVVDHKCEQHLGCMIHGDDTPFVQSMQDDSC